MGDGGRETMLLRASSCRNGHAEQYSLVRNNRLVTAPCCILYTSQKADPETKIVGTEDSNLDSSPLVRTTHSQTSHSSVHRNIGFLSLFLSLYPSVPPSRLALRLHSLHTNLSPACNVSLKYLGKCADTLHAPPDMPACHTMHSTPSHPELYRNLICRASTTPPSTFILFVSVVFCGFLPFLPTKRRRARNLQKFL